MKTDTNNQRLRIGDHVVIYPRGKKGIFTAEVTLPNGQRLRRSLGTSHRKTAIQQAQRMDSDVMAQTFQPTKQQSVLIDHAVNEFMNVKRVEQCARKTLVKYEAELKRFVEFCKKHQVTQLDQLTPRLHDQYRAHRGAGLREYTLHHLIIIHKTFTRWCVSRDMVATDPLAKVKSKRPPRNMVFVPTLDQVRGILKHVNQPVSSVLAMLAFAGLRVGEVANLLNRDVDLDQGWINVVNRRDQKTKTGLSRKVPIHPLLDEVLQDYIRADASAYYLKGPATRAGNKLNPRNPNVWLANAAEALNIPAGRKNEGIVVHSLRHFFRTHLTHCGVPVYIIDEWMGHQGDRSTGRMYFHLTDAMSQQWMAKVNFGGSLHSGRKDTK